MVVHANIYVNRIGSSCPYAFIFKMIQWIVLTFLIRDLPQMLQDSLIGTVRSYDLYGRALSTRMGKRINISISEVHLGNCLKRLEGTFSGSKVAKV
jgi:hypothetical protein